MAVDKQKKEIALSVLEQNTQAKAVWVTFDNQPFLFEEPAIKHHEKYQVKEEPDVFFREGTQNQDEILSKDNYEGLEENDTPKMRQVKYDKNCLLIELESYKKTDEGHRERYEKAISTIKEKDTKIEEISTLNLQYEKKVRELQQENESLKARVLELETAKPEIVKDEGNAPKKGK
ncbi:hypothetical protein [Empedobacter brevis]|uniref:hypothetical protein n=1 Tax=Empedobacter brevis TaxID=247 RepID=UPI0028A0BE67|nr:hypothetical protein [Empedobacter brevis]